ncbi:MAG: hypothetical protein KFB93_07520 [Simkaniaceae bacterium]|nr:MAG: hypothetical protein KFB93_07520 [Simkaniaceae bacterium]
MAFVTFSLNMQHSQVRVKPLSDEARDGFRQTANEIARTVLGSAAASELMCNETLDETPFTPVAPKLRKEVSERELEGLERNTSHYGELYDFVRTMKSFITYVEERLDEVDFSNGYEEEVRNSATLKGMEALFRTYLTFQQSYDQKCRYLEEDRKNPAIKEALTAWFEAAMGNLSLKLLREVAQNNQESRRGQLTALHSSKGTYTAHDYTGLRNYILGRIGALDLEDNPDGWADAALFDLEKFFALPNRFELHSLSPKQQQVVGILEQSLAVLNRYSH